MHFAGNDIMNIINDSYESISKSLQLEPCLSYTQDWSAAPDFLKLIADSCLQNKPEIIVECSSGVTSLVLARCCQLNGVGRVYSLENGEEYARSTNQQLKQYGLDGYAEVLHAPLQNTVVNNQNFDWYQIDELKVSSIEMLVIDGPSGFIQKNSRYPAMPVLFDRFSKGCEIYLDDAGRVDEKEIVECWLNEYSDLKHMFIDNERGCSVLKFKA